MNIELVRDWLSSEGYKYELNDDNTGLRFKYQGLMIYFEADQNDEQFFRLLMPNIYTLENDREKVLEVCNGISSEIKLIKAFLIEDQLFLSIEVFVDSTPEIGDFFERCCDILIHAYRKAAQEIVG